MDIHGSLATLRHGFKCYGRTVRAAYFKAAHELNPVLESRYAANRLGLTRQLHFSPRSALRPEVGVDVTLSLNGIPVATVELKDPLTGQCAPGRGCAPAVQAGPAQLWIRRRMPRRTVTSDHNGRKSPPTDSAQVFVTANPPTASDFRSQRAESPPTECQVRGLSVFAARQDAERALRLPNLRGCLLCRVQLEAGAGHIQQTGRPSHHTWWPLAAFDILARCAMETS